MPPEVVLVIFAGIFGLGGTILMGQRMYYRHTERLQTGAAGDSENVQELRGMVEELQDEVQALQKGAAGFDERLEFTERLLAKPRDQAKTDKDARDAL